MGMRIKEKGKYKVKIPMLHKIFYKRDSVKLGLHMSLQFPSILSVSV